MPSAETMTPEPPNWCAPTETEHGATLLATDLSFVSSAWRSAAPRSAESCAFVSAVAKKSAQWGMPMPAKMSSALDVKTILFAFVKSIVGSSSFQCWARLDMGISGNRSQVVDFIEQPLLQFIVSQLLRQGEVAVRVLDEVAADNQPGFALALSDPVFAG